MCSKFIKLVVLLSLLVCCGFAGRVLYSRFSQLCRTRERSTSHFGVRSGIIFPWSFFPYITQTQRRNTLILGISMAEKSFDYKSWSLEELRAEARKRFILFTRKDGVKTLASKLRMHDRLMSEKESNTEEKLEFEETVDEEEASDLTFDQRLQLLQLERQIRIEEREAEREKREYERQVERERREYERQKAREEEERSIREEERLKTLRNEKEEFAIREAGRQQSCVRKPKFIKIREMREGEDIDDYFRIFEMTAKAQGLPEDEWVGNLVPKLTEKAKSIYLEIPDPAAQNFEESKSIIIKGYQLTADHYRYRFRTSEKKPDEDFVQWGYRTRRYLNRWMTVAEATGDVEKILEQFMIERLLDAVSPELRAWLKEQKPKTAEELGNLANLHVQSRKGPLVEGRYASFGKNKGVSIQKQPQIKREPPIKDQASGEQTKPVITPSRRNIKLPVTCYKCGKQGHMSFNCVKGNNKPAQGYLLCMTPLKSHELEFPPCNVQGKIEGKSAEMIIDSGCTRTLVHEKFVKNGSLTGEEMSVLTATGERLIVPLAKVEIESGQGKHVELVGVLNKLPVDCLLGRSSFGQTLSKENVLKQWERNVSDYDCKINEAFVLTRGQKALVDAQRRADALIDRENSLAVETLSKKEPRQHGLKQGDLPTLFGDRKPEETSDESLVCNMEIASTENEPPINILDRNKTQLAADQNADVTLDRVRRGVSEKAPEESDGYFSQGGILMHRRFIKAEHNGTRYVDRIVVPESYRNEILRVAHTIPLSGHMGFAKTLDRIGAHFSWPGLSSDVLLGKPNLANVTTHRIDTGEVLPIHSSPYKIPQKLEEEVNKEIEKMLQLGIIRPSMSPWASPVVIVPKPDGTIRFCVDYRKVNKVTKMDAYPIPSMERMIEKVASAKYISTIDLTKGYWQIPLETSTSEKSAFITTKGLYEFLVMPFGMKTAPATFQRMMSEIVLRGLEFADAYIDDVEVDTPTSFSQHISELRQVFQRLRTCKLNARPSKCKIAMSSVDFVGHRVGGNRIEPRTALVQTIKEYPRPETKKQIRSFLGLVGYYRRFIPNFSGRAAVLTDLTRGKSPTKIKWKDAHKFAFQDLKQALQNPPVLRPPHWEQEFILQVDASNRGLGAILSQQDKEGLEHPIAYASRKLQPREEKLSTTEKECLGIVWAVELFRYYLFGRKFRLQTDHNPLVWLNQVRDKNRKLLRWSITLQEYDMDVEHKSGKNNSNVDALSRALTC